MVRNRPPNVPKQPDLFHLRAFVSPDGDVTVKDYPGLSVRQIHQLEPSGSRYAVARDTYQRFWLIDLYDLHHEFRRVDERIFVRSHKKFETYEAAIAAAILGWEEGELPDATT